MLGSEMQRLTRELTNATTELEAAKRGLTDLDTTLDDALTIAAQCHRYYELAAPRIRRQINQGLFTRLYISKDGTVERYELTEPFAQLLTNDDQLSPAAPASAPIVTGSSEDIASPTLDPSAKAILKTTFPHINT